MVRGASPHAWTGARPPARLDRHHAENVQPVYVPADRITSWYRRSTMPVHLQFGQTTFTRPVNRKDFLPSGLFSSFYGNEDESVFFYFSFNGIFALSKNLPFFELNTFLFLRTESKIICISYCVTIATLEAPSDIFQRTDKRTNSIFFLNYTSSPISITLPARRENLHYYQLPYQPIRN